MISLRFLVSLANKVFFDGNKRIASAAMILFLDINGLTITASEDEFFNKMIDIANKRMDKKQLASWLTSVTASKEQTEMS